MAAVITILNISAHNYPSSLGLRSVILTRIVVGKSKYRKVIEQHIQCVQSLTLTAADATMQTDAVRNEQGRHMGESRSRRICRGAALRGAALSWDVKNFGTGSWMKPRISTCLLYTSDAADE